MHGRRMSLVRPLWVVASSPALHTGCMAGDAAATAFITGADSFIGRELVAVLVARGHQVFGPRHQLRRQRVCRRRPVIGRTLEPGQWQDEAAGLGLPSSSADAVQPASHSRRAATIASARVDGCAPAGRGGDRRDTADCACGADTSCYGATGSRSITEDEPLRPSAWGRCLTPALDRLDGYVVAGLPIVTALPGGARQRLVVSGPRDRAGHDWPPCAAVWEERAVGVAHSRPRLCPRARASRRARRSRRPLLPRE